MASFPDFMTRRGFLRSGILGGACASSIPGFLDTTLRHVEAAELATGLQRPNGKDSPILLVMQLAGGNDGLNTIIPIANDHYHRARPSLGSVAKSALRLDASFGLHESLTGLKSLYDDGMLGIVHGVGYPNPNRSHFRATEIWHTAVSNDPKYTEGWLGRYLDANCAGMPADVGVSITPTAPQVFQSEGSSGVTFKNPKRFVFKDEASMMMEDGEDVAREGDSVLELGAGDLHPADPLAFLERTNLDAHVASDRIQGVLKNAQNAKGFPESKLASDLELIANLIGGGMPTRVYYASQGGYDTHNDQAETHARLLKEFGDSLQAFWKEMKRQGNAERVCMLVFSEFGRRVQENANAGTDHGAAAPVYVIGGNVRPGFHGRFPSLLPEDLFRGDLQHSCDFRQIYGEVLNRHLAADATAILGKAYDPLGLWG